MTVQELMDQLAQYNPNMPVMARGSWGNKTLSTHITVRVGKHPKTKDKLVIEG